MNGDTILRLARWISTAALEGSDEASLLQGLCDRAVGAGLPLLRVTVGIDTLHPVLEGRWFAWTRDRPEVAAHEYWRSQRDDVEGKWRRSPFQRLLDTDGTMLRRRRGDGTEFPILEDLWRSGATDYIACLTRLGDTAVIGGMDCVYSSWATDDPDGFSAGHLAALETLVDVFALAVTGISVARIADTLVETYLGRDAGRRVLSGRIERGTADRIRAVLWLSDLRGFTRMIDTVPADHVIPLLNEYADATVTAIHDAGGQVLKFMGDGVLAFFPVDGEIGAACRNALDAAIGARARVRALNDRRAADRLPVTDLYLAIHVGEVFYGNIGAADRLDFTVIGPAVNEASRMLAMCRSLDQDAILSSAFAAADPDCRDRLVSLGRYALRGIARPQELFTLDPGRD